MPTPASLKPKQSNLNSTVITTNWKFLLDSYPVSRAPAAAHPLKSPAQLHFWVSNLLIKAQCVQHETVPKRMRQHGTFPDILNNGNGIFQVQNEATIPDRQRAQVHLSADSQTSAKKGKQKKSASPGLHGVQNYLLLSMTRQRWRSKR
jgi:hypothetical protein